MRSTDACPCPLSARKQPPPPPPPKSYAVPPTMHSHAFAHAEGRALQHASPSRKSFRDMPKGSMLGMSWSMEGARLKPLLKPLGMPKRGPEASGMSGSAVDALCMNAEHRPLPKLGAVCRPAHEASKHQLLQCERIAAKSRWKAGLYAGQDLRHKAQMKHTSHSICA